MSIPHEVALRSGVRVVDSAELGSLEVRPTCNAPAYVLPNQLYKGKEEWLKEILGQKRVKEADWTRVVERLPKSSGLA